MHEVLVNRLVDLSLPRKSVVRLTDRPGMTLDVYRGRKTTIQQQQQSDVCHCPVSWIKSGDGGTCEMASSAPVGQVFYLLVLRFSPTSD